MDTYLYNEKRLKVLKLLPLFWGEGVDDQIIADINAGTDSEAIEGLKKLKLYTKEIRSVFESDLE